MGDFFIATFLKTFDLCWLPDGMCLQIQGGSNVGTKFLRYHASCWPAVIPSSKVWKRLWVCSTPFGRSRVAASATHRVTGFLHGQWKRHRCFCHLVPSAGGALGFKANLWKLTWKIQDHGGTMVLQHLYIYNPFFPNSKTLLWGL